MPPIPKFRAIITDKLEIEVLNKDLFSKYLFNMPKEVNISVTPIKKKRSLNQNSYYFGVVINLISSHTGYTPDECHEICKEECLQKKLILLQTKDGEVEKEYPITTTVLTSGEFESYLSKVRMWASQTLGLFVPLPNEVEY